MLLQKENTSVFIFNMQLELIPLLQNGSQLLNNCCWLAEMCSDLQVPTTIIEHKKLGKLSEALTSVAHHIGHVEKTHFDFMEEQLVAHAVKTANKKHYVLAGAETHICILQSAIRLKEKGKNVFLLTDACSSRCLIDHETALERIYQNGIQLITREMFFFELIRHSEFPGYRDLAMKYLDGRYIR
ncbi:MAG: isochorismatase family protein [Yersinia sp. (in: enterobacteria)]